MTNANLTLEQKQAANVWDHIDDALPVIEAARAGKWSWCENTRCKYLVLRIDMRDGGCIISDRDGNRLQPADVAKQLGSGVDWEPWEPPLPLGQWQLDTIARVGSEAGGTTGG